MDGIFRVFHVDEQGKEHIIQFATENWWMSGYISYFNQKPATTNAVCMEDGEVLCLTLHGREKLSADFYKMEHFFRVKLTNGYIALQQRINYVAFQYSPGNDMMSLRNHTLTCCNVCPKNA